MSGKILTKEDIANVQDLPTKRFYVPQWDGDVIIRTISAVEKDQYEQSLFTQQGNEFVRNMENMRAKLCALVLVDEEGNRMYTFREALALGKKSAQAIALIFEEAQKLNGMSKDDREAMVKNSETAPNEDSISD